MHAGSTTVGGGAGTRWKKSEKLHEALRCTDVHTQRPRCDDTQCRALSGHRRRARPGTPSRTRISLSLSISPTALACLKVARARARRSSSWGGPREFRHT